MRSVLAAAALATLVAATTAGCAGLGGSNGNTTTQEKTLSRAQFARAANRACARENRADRAIPKATNPAEALNRVERAIPLLERTILVFHRLAPPPNDAAPFSRLLDALDAEDADAHHLVATIHAGNVRHAKRVVKQLEALGKQVRRLDRRLRLAACLKDNS